MNELQYLARAIKHRLVLAHARSLGKASRTARSGQSIVVIPPASPGGLGDDALMTSLLGQIKERGAGRVQIGQWDATDRWPAAPDAEYFLLPGRSLKSWKDTATRLREADALFVVGADMLDGYYGVNHSLLLFRMADLAAHMGLSATIVGSSFSDAATRTLRRFIAGISPEVQWFARDHLSKARIEAVRPSATPLAADIAFLLKPATTEDSEIVRQVDAWIRNARQRGCKTVIGCNVNSLPFAKSTRTLDELVNVHVEAFTSLLPRHGPLAVVFLPHDRRPPHSDVDALSQLGRSLPGSIEHCDILQSLVPRAAELKAIASRCDAVLSGRMHLGIAALGSGIPTMCLAYQGKYQGLFAHFDLERFAVPNEEALESGRLAAGLDDLLQDRRRIADQIDSKLSRIRDLSRLNVAHLG